jgi:hypothetical protein
MSEPVQLGWILLAVLSDIAKRMEKARYSMLDNQCSHSTHCLTIINSKLKSLTCAGDCDIVFSQLDVAGTLKQNRISSIKSQV